MEIDDNYKTDAANPMKKLLTTSVILIILTGCTSIKVDDVDPSVKLSHVCIEKNPDVIVKGFLPVVEAGFSRHGITTEVYDEKPPAHCSYHLTYVAFHTWDIGMYMHHAELHLYQDHKQIGQAKYHLINRGGLSLNKWGSVKSKMDPVIDELLAAYSPETVDQYRAELPEALPAKPEAQKEALEILKEWHEEGLIDADEYEREKSRILSEL